MQYAVEQGIGAEYLPPEALFADSPGDLAMKLINNAEVSKVLTMADCIRVQEEAFRGLVDYGTVHRPRVDLYYPAEDADSYFRWGSMEGASSSAAIRMKSDIISWPRTDGGGWTEEALYRAWYLLRINIFTVHKNGEPLALINDGILQHFRVGGGAGIGAKYLSREDSEVIGDRFRRHGENLLGGVLLRETDRSVGCTARRRHKRPSRRDICRLGIDVIPVSGPREAIAGADIVSSATTV